MVLHVHRVGENQIVCGSISSQWVPWGNQLQPSTHQVSQSLLACLPWYIETFLSSRSAVAKYKHSLPSALEYASPSSEVKRPLLAWTWISTHVACYRKLFGHPAVLWLTAVSKCPPKIAAAWPDQWPEMRKCTYGNRTNAQLRGWSLVARWAAMISGTISAALSIVYSIV